MEGCLFQKAERKLPLQPKSSPIATEFVPARTQRCDGDLDVAHRNSSREDPPEYASAAWDHWTGRDCATGRPSRSLCYKYWNGQGDFPSRDGGRIRHRLMGTIKHHARYPHRKHACAPWLSCISELHWQRATRMRGPGIMSLGLTDLAGPDGEES